MKGTSPGSTAPFLPILCWFVFVVVVVVVVVVGHVPLRSINLTAEPVNIQDRIFFAELNYKGSTLMHAIFCVYLFGG